VSRRAVEGAGGRIPGGGVRRDCGGALVGFGLDWKGWVVMEELKNFKGLSLWEPWATAMADGLKQNETRSWPMSYRGDLVICAAKKRPTLRELGGNRVLHEAALCLDSFGKALCVVEVYDCQRSEVFKPMVPRPLSSWVRDTIYVSEREWEMGNYEPGRWIFMTRNLRRLRAPVYVTGRQGLFNLSDEESALVRGVLS
jgi:hypothetical protein